MAAAFQVRVETRPLEVDCEATEDVGCENEDGVGKTRKGDEQPRNDSQKVPHAKGTALSRERKPQQGHEGQRRPHVPLEGEQKRSLLVEKDSTRVTYANRAHILLRTIS